MKKTTVKKLIAGGVKIVMASVVLLFLGLRSLDFFRFVTPPEQWYMAYLGFGLTGGAMIAYLIIFLWDADTELKKAVALVMIAVCLVGELLTAGFGLQIEAFSNGGFQLAESDFKFMVIAIQILGLFHGLALFAYLAGDKVAEAFGDADGDGIPNYRDRDYNSPKRPQEAPRREFSGQQVKSYASDTEDATAPKGQGQ